MSFSKSGTGGVHTGGIITADPHRALLLHDEPHGRGPPCILHIAWQCQHRSASAAAPLSMRLLQAH
eukprot:1824401-Prorocentrum_lima.AAC.1